MIPSPANETPEAPEMPRSGLANRLGLEGLDYQVPAESRHWSFMLGGLTLFFLLLLVVTGVYLAQFYNPSPVGAYDSMLYIIARAPFGDWVRSMHYWAAGGAVLTTLLHLVVVFRRRAYRAPREITWWAGVLMAALLFLLIVTGSALRYDQEGFEALAHFVAGGNLTGAFGRFFTEDFTISAPLLPRIFSLHTSLLPLLAFGLLGLHVWLIRQLGIASVDQSRSVFRRHAIRLTGLGLLSCAAVGVLAVVVPEGLGYPAVAGAEVTKPMWPVLWVYGLENVLGAWGMVLGPAVILLFLMAVPLLDRKPAGDPRGSGWVGWTGVGLGVVTLALWLYALFGEAQQHIGM